MNIKQLGNMLNIHEKFLDNKQLNLEMKTIAKTYQEDKEKSITFVERKNNKMEAFLYLALNLALMTKESYKKQGISEEIWLDSMRDIRIWQKAYEDKYGKSGILEPRWVLQVASMEIFKLGSLQFEKIKLEKEVKLEKLMLESGTLVLNVHIPEGTDFSPEKVSISYEKAREFFGIDIFYCDSWLLCKDVKNLLSKERNIIEFAKQYEVISEIRPHPQMEERVFGRWEKDKTKYQETTSLQKKLKKYLLEKNTVSMAKGYFKL